MTWEDILKRDDIVGGDIEGQESGDIYRGPISSITLENGTITIKSEWMAKMAAETPGVWEKWDIDSIFFDAANVKPQDIGNGRIFLVSQ